MIDETKELEKSVYELYLENQELKENYNRLLKENFKLKQHPILVEFTKWLEEEVQKDTYSLYEYNLKQGKKQCLNKLQELR